MAYSAAGNTSASRPLWSSLAERFSGEKECLATYVALETAEVLAGAKPASLLSIPNKERSCGRNLYLLWKQHGPALLAGTPLEACELDDRGSSVLILFSHRTNFGQHLARRDISALLAKAGHTSSAPDHIVPTLSTQLQQGHFPHEIGLLLGYPPKDVAAFMGLIPIPFTCQGPWKIYGNPVESLRLAERFRHCRNLMADQLARCASAVQFLAETGRGIFSPSY